VVLSFWFLSTMVIKTQKVHVHLPAFTIRLHPFAPVYAQLLVNRIVPLALAVLPARSVAVIAIV